MESSRAVSEGDGVNSLTALELEFFGLEGDDVDCAAFGSQYGVLGATGPEDGNKNAQGSKLKPQRAKNRIESQSMGMPSPPQSSTAQLSLPPRPATLAPPDNSTSGMTFTIPMRPATVAPQSVSSPNTTLNGSVSRFTFVRAAIAQAHPFFGLPNNVGAEILSYLPWDQISASRRCCQQFHTLVVSFERNYAKPRIASHEGRLNRLINELNYAQMPTDADTLVASLQLWTRNRGTFTQGLSSLMSLSKWFSHLSGGQVHSHGDDPNKMPFETWAEVATLALRLRFHGHNLGPVKLTGAFREWLTLKMYLQAIPNQPLSRTEQIKLYNHIMSARNSQGDQRDMLGRNYKSQVRELGTFPGSDCHADWRLLTSIRTSVGTPDRPEGTFDDPPIPGEILGRFIWVPDLPYTDTFCYFAKKPWVADLLEDLYRRYPDGKEEMCLLMKARILELIDIF
jgi:hypothetical protein